MSSLQHTPAPWIWNKDRPAKYDLCWLDGSDGMRVLSMYGSGEITPDKRLIAAAPDLLAACKAAIDEVMSLQPVARDQFDDRVTSLLWAAITKATE